MVDVKGHALTLNLLGVFLRDAHGGDVRRRDLVKFKDADDEVQGGHAFHVMAAYETWFASEGEKGERLLAVLRLLGLFDRPASADCLAALRRPPVIVGLTESIVSLSDALWNLSVSRLVSCGLVSPGLTEASSLDAHLLIREYFARQLREHSPEAWQDAHGRLFEHLQKAAEIAEHGPMPLFLTDVHLHRARLFHDKDALAEAHRLIEKHGYGRRLGELADAEASSEDW